MAKLLVALLLMALSAIAQEPKPQFETTEVLLDHVKIHGKEWRIVTADTSKNLHAGLTEWQTRTIYVDRNMVSAQRPEIIFHELFHAVMFEHFSDKVEDGHRFIYDVSPALQRVLADNPALVKLITEKP